mgnify:CR=1 FL=1
MQEELTALRREFHRYPEVSFQEFKTADRIAHYLNGLGIEVQRGIGKTGVVGLLKGDKPGKTVALRADMDALSLTEERQWEYASLHEGVMHACGHDGHLAIVLGAAKILNQKKAEISGQVKFIFQPAEEKVEGAELMIKEGVLDNPRVDAIFGLHLQPDLPAGTVGIKYGPMMAASDLIQIIIKGKGGHGAAPHQGINAIVVAAQVINALQTIPAQQIDPLENIVVSIGTIKGGQRYNIIADQVKILGTVRTLREDTRNQVEELIERIIQGVTAGMGAQYEFRYVRGCPVVKNHLATTQLVEKVAKELVGEKKTIVQDRPVLLGEDFACYLEQIPGTYFWLGTRNEAKDCIYPLHHPLFNLDEEVLPLGAELLSKIALEYLNT